MAVFRFRSVAAWTLFLAVPTGAGLIRGLPPGPIELVAIACVWWLAWRQDAVAGSLVVEVLLVVKIAFALIAPMPGGLRARYYANADWRTPIERCVEFRSNAFTRVDRIIDFAPDTRALPLGFFNDIERFNFYQPNQPDRATLPFSVIWDGYWWADDEAEHRFYIDAPGATAQLTIDGWLAASAPPDPGAVPKPARLRPGWRRVELR